MHHHDTSGIQQKGRKIDIESKRVGWQKESGKSKDRPRFQASFIKKDQRFGKLVCLEPRGQDLRGCFLWSFKCDCGTVKVIRGNHVFHGKIVSCSCEAAARCSRNFKSHGLTETDEYHSWCSMKGRCHNPSNKKYPSYGGRGITLCDRWMDSFENFLADMGKRPTPRHSIDRINNDLGYSPENCRWATAKEQSLNTRRNVFIEFDGKRLTCSQWEEVTGINRACIAKRIKRGWSAHKTLTTKSREA